VVKKSFKRGFRIGTGKQFYHEGIDIGGRMNYCYGNT
jgi:hypothetical protein